MRSKDTEKADDTTQSGSFEPDLFLIPIFHYKASRILMKMPRPICLRAALGGSYYSSCHTPRIKMNIDASFTDIKVYWTYLRELFHDKTIRDFQSEYERIIRLCLDDPNRKIMDVL